MKNVRREDWESLQSTVFGWGINDVEYNVHKTKMVSNKQEIVWRCPYYRKWVKIIERCLCSKFQEKYPTYRGCTVAEDWRYFSNFIKWVDEQPNKDWMNCEPDKDILFEDNKHYSPETVVFVSRGVNVFIVDSAKDRGDHMIGVSYVPDNSKINPYQARCSNPFGKGRHIGSYPTELEAHKAWQAKKHEYACMLADLQEDERVSKLLYERYAPYKDWTNR
jgi:hypothetical protein